MGKHQRPPFLAARVAMIAWLALGAAQASAQTIVGVLEDRPILASGEQRQRVVRTVFFNDGAGWRAYPALCGREICAPSVYPQAVRWTIAFDGRTLGQVSARIRSQFRFYADQGLQDLLPGQTPPTIGAPSLEFAGFAGEPAHRPLIAVSADRAADPEHWQRTELSAERLAQVRRAFRASYAQARNCANSNDSIARASNYADADMRIGKSYASQLGWSLAAVQLQDYRCDGPAEAEFEPHMFAISPTGEVRLLGVGLWLVDAGDYDGDGKSEQVFAISRYNRGGYVLFSEAFARSAAFEYSYH